MSKIEVPARQRRRTSRKVDRPADGMLLDIERNRANPPWTLPERIGRLLWALASPLFRLSPRICWGWRRLLLRLFQASIGAGAHIYPSVRIAIPWNLSVGPNASIGDRALVYNLGEVTLGDCATVSQGAHLCAGTHDYREAHLPLIKATLAIGRGAWICADAFVGPGVRVGEYAIVGARAVVMRDVGDWTIVVGNPAKPVGKRPLPRCS